MLLKQQMPKPGSYIYFMHDNTRYGCFPNPGTYVEVHNLQVNWYSYYVV